MELMGWACVIVAIAIALPLVVLAIAIVVLLLGIASEIRREDAERAKKP